MKNLIMTNILWMVIMQFFFSYNTDKSRNVNTINMTKLNKYTFDNFVIRK